MSSLNTQTGWLEDLRDILERPIRKCRLAHEDVVRDEAGMAIVDEENFNDSQLQLLAVYQPECEVKHIGCPHLFHLSIHANTRLTMLLAGYDDYDHLMEEIESINTQLLATDEDVRLARTGSRIGASPYSAPSKAEAEKAAEPIINDHELFLAKHVEPLRVRLLTIVCDALETRKMQA